MASAVPSGAAAVTGGLGAGGVFKGESVSVKDGPRNIGSVATGEGPASGTNEAADDGDAVVTGTVAVGVTLEKGATTDV